MRLLSFWKMVLLFAVLFGAAVTFGQTGTDPMGNTTGSPVAPDTSSSPIPTRPLASSAPLSGPEVIGQLYDAFINPIKSLGQSLQSSGIALIGSLVMIHIIIGGIMLAAGTTDIFDLVLKGAKLAIVGSLAIAAVQPQAWLGSATGLGGSITLGQAISAGFMQIVNLISVTGVSVGGSPKDFMNSLFSMLSDAVFKMAGNTTLYSGMSGWAILANLFGVVMSAIFILISTLAFAIASLFVLGELFFATLSLELALALAPLMVPWMLFPPLAFLFDAWLRTLLSGLMAYLVGALFAAGMYGFAQKVADVASRIPTNETFNNIMIIEWFSPVLLGSILIIVIAQRIVDLATSLMQGSVGGFSINAFNNAMRGMATAAAAPKQLAGHAGNAARAGVSALKSAGGAVGGIKSAVSSASSAAGAEPGLGGKAKAASASLASSFKNRASAGLQASEGWKAAGNIAKGRNETLTQGQQATMARSYNATYAQQRAQGVGSDLARGAATSAANKSYAGLGAAKMQKQSDSAAPSTPAAPPPVSNPFRGLGV